MEETILKKEELGYKQAFTTRGNLVLTPTELFFEVNEGFFKKKFRKIISVPLNCILNVTPKQTVLTGLEEMDILCNMGNGKERKFTFNHGSFHDYLVGDISRAKGPYFSNWVTSIENAKNNGQNSNGINDLEKLAELKEKGVITEEEFNLKKKQILGI